jgi:hypothetical protein
VLVDSSSSNSFVNATLAPLLQGIVLMSKAVRVQVANG